MLSVALGLLCLVSQVSSPRLLVVDLDDLGDEFLSANPQTIFDTLDQQGLRFDNFYTAPLCSPTRAMFQYGSTSTHSDVQCPWLVGPNHSPYSTPTDGALVPLGRAVTDAGYTAAKVGKWHIAREGDHLHPLQCGWTDYIGTMDNTPSFYTNQVNCNGNISTSNVYLTTEETDWGIAALRAGYNLVSVSYHAIHRPFHVPPAHLHTQVNPLTEYQMAQAMLEALGNELSRLLAEAQLQGYDAVIFSDNGGVSTLGGRKGSIKEKGLNTTMWCVGPNVQSGRRSGPVAVYDIYATILERFGIPHTDEMAPNSISFLGTWSGGGVERRSVYSEKYTKNGESPYVRPEAWARIARRGNMKLVRLNGMDTLYDLGNDPLEQSSLLHSPGLSNQQQKVYEKLLKEIEGWENYAR